VGSAQTPNYYAAILPQWPEKELSSSYLKNCVNSVEVCESGLAGNEIGHPSHISDGFYRAVLVVNELVWEDFEKALPNSSKNMVRGCFGENFVVNRPDLHPNVVCVGDEYRIGNAVFRVSGPRMACPKVDAYLDAKGVTAIGVRTGWTGYFLQIVTPGQCSVGDESRLYNHKSGTRFVG